MKLSRLSYPLTLIAFALLLSGASPDSKSSEDQLKTEKHKTESGKHSGDGTQKTQKGKTAPISTPPIGSVPELPSSKTQPEAAETQQSAIEKWFNPNTAPNWALFLVTIAYVIVATGQLTAIRRQAKFARRTLRSINREIDIVADGVNETRRAANAAQQSADSADRSLKLVERAWLIVRFDMPVDLQWNLPVRVRYSILNAGRNIARLKHSVAFVTTNPGFPELPIQVIDPKIYNITRCVIFPNTPIEQSGRTPAIVEMGTIQGIKDGIVNLIIRGFVVYDDIFDVRHVTKFCQVYSPKWNDGRGGFVMPPEPKPGYENDAD